MEPEKIQAAMQEYARCMQPDERHKQIARMAGKWKTTTHTFWGGNKSPEAIAGSSESAMMHGGRFLVADIIGNMMGQESRTTTVIGYDVYLDRVVSLAYGTVGTGVFVHTGTMNEDGTLLDLVGPMDDPFGKRPMRYIIRIESDDRHVVEVFDTLDGNEVKVVETEYQRVS